jgi:hypothetical protein
VLGEDKSRNVCERMSVAPGGQSQAGRGKLGPGFLSSVLKARVKRSESVAESGERGNTCCFRNQGPGDNFPTLCHLGKAL